MSVDKALNQAPLGLDSLIPNEMDHGIEIEIEDPEAVKIGIDGMEVELSPSQESPDDFDANLADYIDDGRLATLASELVGNFEDDIASRKDWQQTYVDGLELLGMKFEERSEPWEGACGVYHPIMAEALVKFQAETMMSTFPAAGPVKTEIIGKETPEKKDAATRVAADMNYRLTVKNKEYRSEHERMLWGLGLAGNAFKKVYFDPQLGREASIFVPAEDFVVPYGASDLDTSPRATHVMRKTENQVRMLQLAGFWRDIDLGEPNNNLDEIEKKIAEKLGFRATTDDRYKILEMMVDLDLEGFEHKDEDGYQTGLGLPYIVTIDKASMQILAIRRNWRPEDELHRKRQHYVHYEYIPGFGFYALGLIHLLGAFAKSGTSILRQLVDAGSLANLPGGFKARGMRIKGDDTPIAPGEFRDVDVPSGSIKDNLITLPYKEPSQTLFNLMNQIIEEGKGFANIADMNISDMSANTPVGTTLAILERNLKVMSAVQARIHASLKEELGLLKDIIRDYTPDEYGYEPEEGSRKAKKSDYDMVEVIPVSDPNASTMAQKIVQYQAALQLAQTAPQLYNLPLLHRQMLEVLGIKNTQKLIPMVEDMKPVDPVTENQNVLMMKPVKAFSYQDHQAHISVHMAAMQDPKIQQLLQGNQQAPQMMAAMQAHICEHLGFEYRIQIEQQLGMNLPAQFDEAGDEANMAPEVEEKLSPLLAQAAQRLLQGNQAQAAQQQAQQQQQDPLIQMQQQELQIKMQDQQRKAQKDQTDAALKKSQQDIEVMRIHSQAQMSRQKDISSLLGDVVKQKDDQRHEKEIQQRELMAHGLETAFTEHRHSQNEILKQAKENHERASGGDQKHR